MTVGLAKRRVNGRSFLYVLLGSLVANLLGCIAATYLFGRATELFLSEPHLSFVRGLAEGKARADPGVTFLRAIPANIMICFAIHLGISARDMLGKLAALHFPLTVYTVAGFEHAVGTFVALPLGAMYGAEADLLRAAWANILPAIAGNFVGGAAVGLSELLLFSWDQGQGNTNQLHNHAHDAAEARARALALQAKLSLLSARRRISAFSHGSSSPFRSPAASAPSGAADVRGGTAGARSDGMRAALQPSWPGRGAAARVVSAYRNLE
jgi:hypothetical protein